ncbi:hypothetical protein PG999_000128 [Apiospora kogelbergensis]|uniref:Uncharacterized protein n=1 Tax=Apiospora kogelbergensis TaxID=1337665 RepID=A0AAW0RAN1_9PEZI
MPAFLQVSPYVPQYLVNHLVFHKEHLLRHVGGDSRLSVPRHGLVFLPPLPVAVHGLQQRAHDVEVLLDKLQGDAQTQDPVFQASMVGSSSWGTVGDIATGVPVLLLPPPPDPDPAMAVQHPDVAGVDDQYGIRVQAGGQRSNGPDGQVAAARAMEYS